jgi:hydroxyacylglutathione hydrolase
MQITDRIHALRIPFKIPIGPEKMIERIVYSYIVFGSEITLIDTGVTGAETVIFDYLRKHGREPAEISLVVLTHSHPDHIGSVKAVREATGCRIAAHLGEKEWIEDTDGRYHCLRQQAAANGSRRIPAVLMGSPDPGSRSHRATNQRRP